MATARTRGTTKGQPVLRTCSDETKSRTHRLEYSWWIRTEVGTLPGAMSEIETIRAMVALLTPSERRRLIWLGAMLTVSGIAEMIGIGVVFSYLAILGAASAGVAPGCRYCRVGSAVCRSNGWL